MALSERAVSDAGSAPTNVTAHFETHTRAYQTLIARHVCFAGAPL